MFAMHYFAYIVTLDPLSVVFIYMDLVAARPADSPSI